MNQDAIVHAPACHPAIPAERIGVLLVNLGTPDAADYWSVRRYLREFLSDPRVIEVNPLIWQPILNLVILSVRPFASARAYRKVWETATDESPLRRHTREQAEGLQRRLQAAGPMLEIAWAMRYGTPSIAERLEAMRARGCRRILLVALYPQYSATTMATVYDKAFEALRRMRWQPAIRTLPAYPGEPAYIAALATSVRTHLTGLTWQPDVLLASFHGLPQRYFDAGDPYHCHCALTTRLLAEALGWPRDRVMLTFQSRFGREEWLRPYIKDVVRTLPASGRRRVAVVTPGFVSDCLETLEEVAMGLRQAVLDAGGEHFTHIPCLNASEAGLHVLETLVRRELSGWLPRDVPLPGLATAGTGQ